MDSSCSGSLCSLYLDIYFLLQVRDVFNCNFNKYIVSLSLSLLSPSVTPHNANVRTLDTVQGLLNYSRFLKCVFLSAVLNG